ncbi:MAG TPA: DUF3482 domain-containing protein, partial [Albitalea sp.]
AAFDRLREAWAQRGRETWHAAMGVLAERLARAALDQESLAAADWTDRLSSVGAVLGLRREAANTPRDKAMRTLAERLDADIRRSTDRLIRLHGLEGHATDVVLTRLAEHFAVNEPVDEGKAAIWGGLVTGALAGLKADIVSGGLTMGGGLLAGGVLGALSAAGVARGVNVMRGVEVTTLRWDDKVLDGLARSALLGYLAVAHYGRGRGDWAESEHPAFWGEAVDAVMADRSAALQGIWSRQRGAASPRSDELTQALQGWLIEASADLLMRLYPTARLPRKR